MTMTFETQQVAGHRLRVARSTGGHPVTVVMTNALPQSIRCWESVWDRLAAHFDLLAVDLPGFARSTGSEAVMRPSAQAEVLVEVMDANGIDQAVVVGPDIGVPVALWLASAHPERVLAVNVFDGPGTWPTEFHRSIESAVRSGLVRWLATHPPLRRRIMAQNLAIATSEGYERFTPSPEAAAEYEELCFDPDVHRRAFAYFGSYVDELPLVEQRLSTLRVPVLVTWGGKDPFVSVANAHRLHELIPDSELTIFDDAGHFSHEDADQEWIDRFSAFVAARHVAPG
ncbi:MAG: alpha/beta hydrolase [Actinomycetota bacterium]